jgi:hypothetical protein
MWYQSKTFWTLTLQGAFNLLVFFGVVTGEQVVLYTNVILTVLGIIFRWVASGPLTAAK